MGKNNSIQVLQQSDMEIFYFTKLLQIPFSLSVLKDQDSECYRKHKGKIDLQCKKIMCDFDGTKTNLIT